MSTWASGVISREKWESKRSCQNQMREGKEERDCMEQLLSGIPDARPMNPAERERKKGEENDKDDGSFKNTKFRHESTSE